jgi:hypothetical protein
MILSRRLVTEQIADHEGVGAGECGEGADRVPQIVQPATADPGPLAQPHPGV